MLIRRALAKPTGPCETLKARQIQLIANLSDELGEDRITALLHE